MTTALDTALRAAVLGIANDLGATATYVVVDDVFDPASADTQRRMTRHAVKVTPPSSPKEFAVGELIEQRDLGGLFAGSGLEFVPKPGDKVIFQGVTFAVVGAPPIMSGDLACAYTLRLRR